jgi:hypothetical protein
VATDRRFRGALCDRRDYGGGKHLRNVGAILRDFTAGNIPEDSLQRYKN